MTPEALSLLGDAFTLWLAIGCVAFALLALAAATGWGRA